jgi:Protein of unknown function (DUF3618)
MGQDARAGGTQVSAEGTREPEQIRRDIESTRDELGDTVAALAEKADVKTQAHKKVAGVKDSVDAKRRRLMGKARQKSPDSAGSAASTLATKARENPVALALAGGFAAGVIVGLVLKR